MMTGYTDNEIISFVLNGNQGAYAQLVDRYQNYVFTLVLRLVKSREDAEELAQDAFVKAFKYLKDFRGDSKFSTWLYTIVNNTCITFLRKKRLEVQSLDNEQVFSRADNLDSGMRSDAVEHKSKQAMVNEAIKC
jgi:RNA polymerase sigma-70 factor (ECF subfamily)